LRDAFKKAGQGTSLAFKPESFFIDDGILPIQRRAFLCNGCPLGTERGFRASASVEGILNTSFGESAFHGEIVTRSIMPRV